MALMIVAKFKGKVTCALNDMRNLANMYVCMYVYIYIG